MKGQEGDVSHISDYRGGEPLKLIHWKLSARHDRLKVKELSAASHTPVTIDLDAIPGAGLDGDSPRGHPATQTHAAQDAGSLWYRLKHF